MIVEGMILEGMIVGGMIVEQGIIVEGMIVEGMRSLRHHGVPASDVPRWGSGIFLLMPLPQPLLLEQHDLRLQLVGARLGQEPRGLALGDHRAHRFQLGRPCLAVISE